MALSFALGKLFAFLLMYLEIHSTLFPMFFVLYHHHYSCNTSEMGGIALSLNLA